MADKNWTGNGDGSSWSDASNWDTGLPGNGDTPIIADDTNGSTVALDVDHNALGIKMAAVKIGPGMQLIHHGGMNTWLRIDDGGDLDVDGEYALGKSGQPITNTYTAKLSFSPASHGNCQIDITTGGGYGMHAQGSVGWGRSGTAWVGVLASQADLNQSDLVLTAASDWTPDPTVSMVVLIEQKGNNDWSEWEVGTVTGYNAGTHTITLSANLSNNHAQGARVFAVSRNVHVFSETAYGWTLNATNGMVTAAEAYYEKCYRNGLEISGSSFDHCTFRGVGSDRIFTGIGADGDVFNFDHTLLFDADTALYLPYCNLLCNELHVQGCEYLFGSSFSGSLEVNDGSINVRYTPLTSYRGTRVVADKVYFFSTDAVNAGVNAHLYNCEIDTPNGLTDLTYYGGLTFLDNCKFTRSATLANTYRAYVVSRNHNQVPGAAKLWTQGSLLQKTSSPTYGSSDWALGASPGNFIDANHPLWVKVADIACKGGDTITVSAWCRVNSSYGTSNDPSLVLDRGNCNGVEAEQTFAVEAADTWYQATISNQTVAGDADDDVLVGLWLEVPHYASGASVFIDKVEVSGASAVRRGELDYWPFEQVHAISGATRGKHGGKQ